MLKKTINYTDWDGKSQTRVFYFNISAAEMAEMEITHQTGSFKEYLQGIVEADDRGAIFKTFKLLLAESVGHRRGEHFIKSLESKLDFMNSGAYDEFLIELMGNTQQAIDFFNGVFPQADDLQAKLRQYTTSVELPQMDVPTPNLKPAVPSQPRPGSSPLGLPETVTAPQPSGGEPYYGNIFQQQGADTLPLVGTDGRLFAQYTAAELAAMSKSDLDAMIARTKAAEAGKVLGN